jgi:uncharacterized protein (DUF433 family)
MTDTPITETIPIYTDEHGRMRVSTTRVLLDLIVHAYHQGQTPEHIVQMYPTLTLDQVYLAIGYYLRHRQTVDAYIRRMETDAEQTQQKAETDFPPQLSAYDLMKRLRARQDDDQ